MLDERGIKTSQINAVCGTKSMAGRWREKTWSQVPKSAHWEAIKKAFNAPDWLEPPRLPPRLTIESDYMPQTDCKQFVIGRDDKPDHPTPKPLNVMEWFVSVVNRNTICDPFMGSGTTGVACARLDSRFIGIEREPRYFDIACRRIAEAQRQTDLFIARPTTLPESRHLELAL
jgi:DNA modification methylase